MNKTKMQLERVSLLHDLDFLLDRKVRIIP